MGLSSELDPRLIEYISSAYEKGNFSAAILDSIFCLGDVLREKSNSEKDGTALINEVLSGKNPTLKINPLQTETEKNIQEGISHILRGIFLAIRNPRAHEKHNDTQLEAEAIIHFINYLIGIIDKSRSVFTIHSFLKRVTDSNFVPKDRYAELLIDEIPLKYRLEVLIAVYREKEKANPDMLSVFIKCLLKKLSTEEINQFYTIVSEEINEISSNEAFINNVMIFPADFWLNIQEVARLRLENKIIKSINLGRIIKEACNLGGQLGTLYRKLGDNYLLKDELEMTVYTGLLYGKPTHIYYLLRFHMKIIEQLAESEDEIISAFKNALTAGENQYYFALRDSAHRKSKLFKELKSEFGFYSAQEIPY
jgi:uncharacterized protein (TIGR02391 family)